MIFFIVICASCDKNQQSNKKVNPNNKQTTIANSNTDKKKEIYTIDVDNAASLKSMKSQLIDTFKAGTSAGEITYTLSDATTFRNGPESFYVDSDKTIYILNTPSKNILIKNKTLKVLNIDFTVYPVSIAVSKGKIYIFDCGDAYKKIYVLDANGNLLKSYDVTRLNASISSRFIILNNNDVSFYNADYNEGITLESLEKKNLSMINSVLMEKDPKKACTFDLKNNNYLDINFSYDNYSLHFISKERDFDTFRPISLYPDLVFNSELLKDISTIDVRNIILAYKPETKETYIYELPLNKCYNYPNTGNYFFMSDDKKLYIMISDKDEVKIYQLIY